MSSKDPKFFCEFCGAKVDKWAIQCDKCNRIFDSIKCPKCSNFGKAEDFPNGCPKCGFQSSSLDKLRDSIISAQGSGSNNLETANHKEDAKLTISRKILKDKYHTNKNSENLPSWMYLLIIGLLTAVIGVMAIILLNIISS